MKESPLKTLVVKGMDVVVLSADFDSCFLGFFDANQKARDCVCTHTLPYSYTLTFKCWETLEACATLVYLPLNTSLQDTLQPH